MKKNCQSCKKEFNAKRSVTKNCSKECGNIYKTFWNGNITPEESHEKLRSMLEQRVIKNSTGCWGWKGFIKDSGYGAVRVNNKMVVASRASWMVYYGDIPDGMKIAHFCDNPICCNPLHLFLATHTENMQDMVNKGRKRYGQDTYNSKLTNEQVIEIRRLIDENVLYLTQIAKKFNVSPGHISDIKLNKKRRKG